MAVVDVRRARKAGARHGRRPYDRPLWWVLAYHLGKGVVQVLTIIGMALLARWLGVVPIPLP